MQSTPHAQSAQSTAKPKLPQLLVPAASSLSAMQIQLVVACGRDRAIGERTYQLISSTLRALRPILV